MRILRTSGFVFLVLTFASPVLAEESNVVSGVGASSCGKFTNSYKENTARTETLYFSWAQGFMSSINFNRKIQNGTPVDFGAMPSAAQLGWIRNYCQKNPMKTYLRAATELFLALEQAQKKKSISVGQAQVELTGPTGKVNPAKKSEKPAHEAPPTKPAEP
jgi:hypothetical protein